MEESSGLASAPVRQILSTCTVDVEMWPNNVVVSVVGELDMADGDQVGKILIDAAEARQADHPARTRRSDVRRLIGHQGDPDGAQAAEERGVTYELVNPHDRVRRLLEVTGLSNVLTIVDEAAYQEGPNSL